MSTEIKKKSRTVYAIKNIFLNLMNQGVNIITNILLPPLIIGKFGSAVNGLITTIKQIIGYIQIVGAGISESTVVSLYKPLEKNDHKKISAIYNASDKTFNRAGIIFSMISVLVAFVYPLFLKDNLQYDFIVKIILILALSGVSEFFVIGKYRTLLISDQRMYIVNIAQIVGAILSTALTILLIHLNYNIVIVQLVAAIAYICRIIILYIYIHKHYNFLDKKEKPDYTAVAKRKAATIHQVSALIIFGSQTLFIANVCGLTEASVYSVYNLIFTGINTVLATISSSMLAGMGSLIATGDEERVKKVYGIYEYGYYILVFTFYITTFITIIPFISIYTNGITDANYIRPELAVLFAIVGILNCLRTPGGTMINAKGHYEETKNRALIEMSICIIGQMIFVGKFGIVGVLIGTMLAYLYRTLDVIIYSNKKILKQSPKKTLYRILLNVIIMIVMCYIIQINTSLNSYLIWGIYALIVMVLGLMFVSIVNIIFDKKTTKDMLEYVQALLKGRRDVK